MKRRDFCHTLCLSLFAGVTSGCSLLSRRDDDYLSAGDGTRINTKTGWVMRPDGSMTDIIEEYNDALDRICVHNFGRSRVVPAMLGSVRFNYIESDFRCPYCKIGMLEDNLEDEFIPPEPGDRSNGRGWFQVFGTCLNVACRRRAPIKGAVVKAPPLAMVYEPVVAGLVIPVPVGGWLAPRFSGLRLPELPPLRVPMEPLFTP
jgi:hypothetical protein